MVNRERKGLEKMHKEDIFNRMKLLDERVDLQKI